MSVTTPDETVGTAADQAPVVLSVVMPNYNHADHLSGALTAILTQSRLPDEIVLIDDGSTDHSRSMIDAWTALAAEYRAVAPTAEMRARFDLELDQALGTVAHHHM